ncbi:MAG TPA: hypothetical protein DDZ43_09100 [Hyphomonadaceae bacterium]|nr:hypothetical protein [Hyphomonadaceae bacterium]
MPHTRAALAMNASSSPTGQSVNKALLNAIRAADWTKAGIDLRAGMDKQETRYGMVFGLSRESVLQSGYRPSEDATAFNLRLTGYNILYDILDRRIIATFAVRGRYFTALAGNAGGSALPELYFDLLANKQNTGSIARFMTDLALDYEYDIKYRGKNFRYIDTVTTEFGQVAADLIGLDPVQYGEEIALVATTAFSEKLKVPVIPYQKTTAVNRRMLREMTIVSSSGDSPLNTALPLAEAQIGIRVFNHGWEFQERDVELQGRIKTGQLKSLQNKSLVDFNQVEVTLGARIGIQIFEIEGGRPILSQQFFGQWAFLEYADPEFQMDRKSRVYLLHETLLDRAFDGILNEDIRGKLYDGLSIQQKADEAYYLEALSEDWDVLSGECADVAALLPRAFGA